MKKLIIVSLSVVLVFGLIGMNATAMQGNRGHMGRRTQDDIDQSFDDFENFGFGDMMGFGGMMGSGRMMHTSIESEYDFLIKMIPHHEEAVRTATTLRDNTDSEEMREFASEIIATQSEEIDQMNSYLDNWYSDRENDFVYEPMMGDYSDIESPQLEEAFLEDMIFHHMEAVMMSQQLLAQGLAEHEEVAELAVSISNSQREEIFMMRNWLADSYAASDQRFRGGMMSGMGMMRSPWFDSDISRFSDMSEEEIREIQRDELRTIVRIEVLMEEYRELIKEEAPEQELIELEDQIFELQDELNSTGIGFFSNMTGILSNRIRHHRSW